MLNLDLNHYEWVARGFEFQGVGTVTWVQVYNLVVLTLDSAQPGPKWFIFLFYGLGRPLALI